MTNLIVFAFNFVFINIICCNNGVFRVPDPLTEFNLTDKSIVYSNESTENYFNVLIDNHTLFVSANNYVFKLNSANISDLNATMYYARRFDATFSHDNAFKNHIHFLGSHIVGNSKHLIICTTNGNNPLLLNLNLHANLSYKIEYGGVYICPGTEKHTSLGLLSFDEANPNGVAYSAVWISEKPVDDRGIYSRYGIFRKHTENNEQFARSLSNPHWLWEPEFFAIYEDEFQVFYFFSEYSIEEYFIKESASEQKRNNLFMLNEMNSSVYPRYARVARVCKNDKSSGGNTEFWTTFRKFKIECNCGSNRTNFNFNNLVLVKQFDNGKRFIAIFHENLNYLTDISAEQTYTVIAEFSAHDLNERFKVSRFWSYQPNELFEEYSNSNKECNGSEESQNDYENYHKFLTENTILDTKLTINCKLILPYRITSIEVEKLNEHLSVFYVSTDQGELLKLVREDIESIINYKVVSKWIFKYNFDAVNKLLLGEQFIYATTKSGTHQLNVREQCYQYKHCAICMNDPHCKWDSEKRICNNLNDSNKLKYYNDKEVEEYCDQSNRNNSLTKVVINAKINETVILKCLSEELIMKFTKNLQFKRVKWLFNNQSITTNSNINYLLSTDGDLILPQIETIYSGIYTCSIDFSRNISEQTSKYKLNVIESNTKSSIATTTTGTHSNSIIDDSSSSSSSSTTTIRRFSITSSESLDEQLFADNNKNIKVYCCDKNLLYSIINDWKIDIEKYINK